MRVDNPQIQELESRIKQAFSVHIDPLRDELSVLKKKTANEISPFKVGDIIVKKISPDTSYLVSEIGIKYGEYLLILAKRIRKDGTPSERLTEIWDMTDEYKNWEIVKTTK